LKAQLYSIAVADNGILIIHIKPLRDVNEMSKAIVLVKSDIQGNRKGLTVSTDFVLAISLGAFAVYREQAANGMAGAAVDGMIASLI